jgi:hypothetical protein
MLIMRKRGWRRAGLVKRVIWEPGIGSNVYLWQWARKAFQQQFQTTQENDLANHPQVVAKRPIDVRFALSSLKLL